MDIELRVLIERALINHTAFQDATRRATQIVGYRLAGGKEPAGLALVGESRTGKSRCLEALQSAYPRKRTPEGLVVPILTIRVPAKPTVKSLVEQLLRRLEVPDWDRGTETQKTDRFYRFVESCGVRALVLDEFHHFFDKASHKVQHYVSDWLKNVMSEDEVGLSVIASGLSSLRNVINQNEQLEGRFGDPVVMPRFDWANEDSRSEWLGILESFDEDVMGPHFSMPELNDDDMAFRLYCATGGLIGYLTNILRQVVWNACDAKKKTLTMADFERGYREAIWRLDKRKVGDEDVTPFNRKWNVQALIPALAAAAQVGKPSFETDAPRKRGATSISKVLSA